VISIKQLVIKEIHDIDIKTCSNSIDAKELIIESKHDKHTCWMKNVFILKKIGKLFSLETTEVATSHHEKQFNINILIAIELR